MPVQSSRSVPSALVDCSNPADYCARTMTWRDVGGSLATQSFDNDSVVMAPKNSGYVQNLPSAHIAVTRLLSVPQSQFDRGAHLYPQPESCTGKLFRTLPDVPTPEQSVPTRGVLADFFELEFELVKFIE